MNPFSRFARGAASAAKSLKRSHISLQYEEAAAVHADASHSGDAADSSSATTEASKKREKTDGMACVLV